MLSYRNIYITLPSLMLREHLEERAVVIGARGWGELLQNCVF